MTTSSIAFTVLGIFWTFVAIMLGRAILRGSRKRTPAPAPRPTTPTLDSTVCPRIPEWYREDELPIIPKYLLDPFVFRDAHLGIGMIAGWPIKAAQLNATLGGYCSPTIERWIFRAHGDHWCTVRRAHPGDIEAIENVKRYARTLLIAREQ